MVSVFLNRADGKFYYLNDATGVNDELPDDFELSDNYIEIPHKNELDLGNQLVFDFVRAHSHSSWDEIRHMFSRKGAYRRWSSWLARTNLRDKWFDFEQTSTTRALKQWCCDNSIELKPDVD